MQLFLSKQRWIHFKIKNSLNCTATNNDKTGNQITFGTQSDRTEQDDIVLSVLFKAFTVVVVVVVDDAAHNVVQSGAVSILAISCVVIIHGGRCRCQVASRFGEFVGELSKRLEL